MVTTGLRVCCLSISLVMTLVVTSAAAPQALDPVRPAGGPSQVIIGMLSGQEPDVLNPLFFKFGQTDRFHATIFVRDVVRDEKWRPIARGVEYLPSMEDGTWQVDDKGMTLLWKIRPRNWQDGRPVTCTDYVFSHTVARDTRVPVVVRDITNRIASVSCPQGSTGLQVQVRWKDRFAYANLGVTENGPLPRHLLEGPYRINPSGLSRIPYGNEARATIGDGAYRLVSWRPDEDTVVESVGTHPILGTPKIRRITWRRFPDTPALVRALLDGTIDVIGAPGVIFTDARALEHQSEGRIRLHFDPGQFWEHIDFNLDNPLLQDVRVRRALAHAVNRTQIVQQLFSGKTPVAHTYLQRGHEGFTVDVQRYPYDPARSRALFKQAGFTPGPDGILQDQSGRRFVLEFSTTAGSREREELQYIIRDQLRAVGVEVRIVNFPFRVLFGSIMNRRRFTGLALYGWILSPTSDCDQVYTSDGIPTESNGWTGQNYPGFRNAEMDRICRSIVREVDEARRIGLLRESARIFSRELPALPLYFRVIVAATKTGLMNFSLGRTGFPAEIWNAHEWYWQ